MIEIKKICKSFKETKVLKNVTVTIEKGQVMTLIGPSGCGKTTLLKMINRLLKPTSGDIKIHGRSIYQMDVIKLRRSIGYVIQQTGLFPHMTIQENIELIPKAEKYSEDKIKKRTLELMDMIGMDANEYLCRYPSELSGGQQQRIGVARAFATDPEIILMDEPFSALDPITRTQLQDELLRIQSQLNKTIVFVTHDMDEAIKIADDICIMNEGEILQHGVPEDILKHPNGEFVADFIGHNKIWQSPEYIRAEDIMIEHPAVCAPTFTLDRSLDKMRERKVDSLLVQDKTGKLLGMIRAKDIREQRDRSLLVKEVLVTDYTVCNKKDSILEILTLFQDSKFSDSPVVDEQGKLCGLLTKSSLLTSLSQPILEQEEGRE